MQICKTRKMNYETWGLGTYEYSYLMVNCAFWVISQAHEVHAKLRTSVRSSIDTSPNHPMF